MPYRPQDWFTIRISKSSCTLTVLPAPAQPIHWYGLALPRVYPVAIGGHPDGGDKQAVGDRRTPEGAFRVCQKQRLAPGSPFGGHWLRLDTRHLGWEGIGIHGTNRPESIGTRASAGCIRLHNADAAELYRLVPVGTLVVIER
jgi:lipoprotein-anchoring transpeptidase ErfK/SrfK